MRLHDWRFLTVRRIAAVSSMYGATILVAGSCLCNARDAVTSLYADIADISRPVPVKAAAVFVMIQGSAQ